MAAEDCTVSQGRDPQSATDAPSRRAVLSDLTLAVLAYNRPNSVQRLLRYLRAHAPEISLVLIDHGDAASQESNAAALAQIRPEIKHVRLDVSTSWADILTTATAEMATPYAALCPDDDIPVIAGVIDAVSMLAADPQMACAQGYALSFRETESAVYFGPVEDYVPSYDDSTPLPRLFGMMRRYQPVFFGYYRTDALTWSIREFIAANIPNLMFQEFFHAALVCARGTIGRSPSISLWRRITGSHTDRRTIHPFHLLINSPAKLGTDYRGFCEKLIPYFSRDEQSAGDEAAVRRLIDLVFLQFLVRHIDYGELDGKIRELLRTPGKDHFAALPALDHGFDATKFLFIRDIPGAWVSKDLLEEAAQVTQELLNGVTNTARERSISIDMLVAAIRSALEYQTACLP
jgi:glycosyltransferase domain-containing protein